MERPDPSEYADLPPFDDGSDVVTGERANSGARRHMRQSQRAGSYAAREARAFDTAQNEQLKEDSGAFARQQGYPARGVTPAAPAPSSSFKLPVHGLGGFVVGAVLAANLLAFLEYGRPGVSPWWSAKFWNSPTIGTAAPSTTSGTVQAPGTTTAGGRG